MGEWPRRLVRERLIGGLGMRQRQVGSASVQGWTRRPGPAYAKVSQFSGPAPGPAYASVRIRSRTAGLRECPNSCAPRRYGVHCVLADSLKRTNSDTSPQVAQHAHGCPQALGRKGLSTGPHHGRSKNGRVTQCVEVIGQLLTQNFHAISRAQLLAGGCSQAQLDALVRAGTLRRVRPGWYADPTAEWSLTQSVRLGGTVTCLAALAMRGVWVPPTPTVHVRRSRRQRGQKMPKGFNDCRGTSTAGRQAVDSVPGALAAALKCANPDTAVVVLDSAQHKRFIRPEEVGSLMTGLPASRQMLLRRSDRRAESGTETLVRLRLRRRGVKLRIQVQIDDVGRVDLLVGDRLVLEVDSWTYHADPIAYARDRERDRRLVALDYVVVRLRYEEVMFGWASVERDILTLIRDRRHRRPRTRPNSGRD